MGPVAQRIRARGYEPRCRGFESLLAHNRPQREGPFPFGSRKIMIGIADPKLWNLGVGLLFITCYREFFFYLRIVCPGHQHIFFFMPHTSSSARLGQNSRASTSISSIAKMRSSSLICLLAVIVASRENR